MTIPGIHKVIHHYIIVHFNSQCCEFVSIRNNFDLFLYVKCSANKYLILHGSHMKLLLDSTAIHHLSSHSNLNLIEIGRPPFYLYLNLPELHYVCALLNKVNRLCIMTRTAIVSRGVMSKNYQLTVIVLCISLWVIKYEHPSKVHLLEGLYLGLYPVKLLGCLLSGTDMSRYTIHFSMLTY